MQNDFDIDQLKNAWQKQETGPKYQDSEILEILNKKSRNYVKFIFGLVLLNLHFFLSLIFLRGCVMRTEMLISLSFLSWEYRLTKV